jgi:uncharacterized protein
MFFLTLLFMQGEEISLSIPYLAAHSIDIYQNGTFLEITRQRMADWSYTNNLFGLFMMLFTILPLFLIGAGAAKYKWLEHIKDYRKGLSIAWIITFTVGMILKWMPYLFGSQLVFRYVQDYFGGPLLAISYGLLIALLSEKMYFHKLLLFLANVGRMSLTNYLLQSSISTLLFYHYGLGLYGKASVFTGTILVLVIYIAQILLSHIWLKHYNYGPIEWLWRNFSYWKKQNLHRVKKVNE